MRGVHLMRIAGIDVTVDWSLLIIFVLIVTSLASGVFPQWHPDWGPAAVWLTALAAAVLFFASILVHELSHSLVGRANGIPVHNITLFMFGGMAHIEHEPERWSAELWMAIVGPLTSLAIGVLCLLAAAGGFSALDLEKMGTLQGLLSGLSPGRTLLMWLGPVNIILALFNLVPAFPLDGGRVLRAILWGATHDLGRATRWAASLGRAFAVVLIGSGVAMALGINVPLLGRGIVDGIWIALIGWFLNNAAVMSYRQQVMRDALKNVPVTRLMLTQFETVPPQLPVETLIDAYMSRSDQVGFPVVDAEERFLGMVSPRDIERRSPDQRRTMTAREAMKPVAQLTVAHSTDAATEVFDLLTRRDLTPVPVVENGRVVGLVRRADVLRWISLHSAPKQT